MILNNIIFAIIFLVNNMVSTEETEVAIKIYYESLCPYSRQYVIDQLYPTYNSELGKYLNIELFPIALHYTPDGSGGWNFECQHGNNECVGNQYQVCLIDQIKEESIQIAALNCILDDNQPHSATEKVLSSKYK